MKTAAASEDCFAGFPMTPRTPESCAGRTTPRTPNGTPRRPEGCSAPSATPRSPRLIPHGWSSTALPTPRRTTALVSELLGSIAEEVTGAADNASAVGAITLVSLLSGKSGRTVAQMAAAAVCNWALECPDAQADLIDAGAIKPLVGLLADPGMRLTAAQALLALTCTVPEARDQLAKCGGIPPLLSFLFAAQPADVPASEPSLAEVASGVLAYLSTGSAENARNLVCGGGVEAFVKLLCGRHATGVAAEVAASAICNLAKLCPDARPRIRLCGGIAALVHTAGGALGRSAVASAIQGLLVVSADDAASQAEIRRHGGVKVLARLISAKGGGAADGPSGSLTPGRPAAAKVTEAVLCCLWNVLAGARGDDQVLEALRAEGGLEALVELLKGQEQLATTAAGILGDLAKASRTARNAISLAGGVEGLVLLLRRRPRGQVAEACCSALANLAASHPGNQHAVRRAGGVVALVAALSYCSEDLEGSAAEEACRALGSLARNMANRDAVREADGIHWLVGVLDAAAAAPEKGGAGRGSPHAARQALVALGNLAEDCHANQVAIADLGGVQALVAAMVSSDPAGEHREMAACVLACLMSCDQVAARADAELVGHAVWLLLAGRPSDVLMEALLNTLASVSAFPGMPDAIRRAGGIEALARALAPLRGKEEEEDSKDERNRGGGGQGRDAPLSSHRSPRDAAAAVRAPDAVAEIAAITLGSIAVGSALNRAAARDSGALAALVHLVLASGPSVRPGANFAKALMHQVSSSGREARAHVRAFSGDPNNEQREALVVRALVHLMGAGPDNVLSRVAGQALAARQMLGQDEGPAKDSPWPDQEVHVMAASTHLLQGRQKLSELNKKFLLRSQPGRGDEDARDCNDCEAVPKLVSIDPRKSLQVEALYQETFLSSATPSPACKAAVSALAALCNRDEGNQVAMWETGGTRLLEALLSLGAMESQNRFTEDAVRVLQAVASAPQNRNGLLESGGTELLINLLRLGPTKDLSYVVARVLSLLICTHEPTVEHARELGAVEMMLRLLEPSRCPAAAGAGKRSIVIALCKLCTSSRDSQAVFRKAGGIRLLLGYMETLGGARSSESACWAARLAGILCADNKANKDAINALDGPRALVQLLLQIKRLPPKGGMQVLQATRQSLASHAANQAAFGRARGVEVLTMSIEHFLRKAPTDSRSEAVCSSLIETLACAVADNVENQDRAKELGTIPLLVQCLASRSTGGVTAEAVEALKVLARNHTSNKDAILAAGGTKELLRILALDMETELGLISNAAWAINNLVHNSPVNVEEVLSQRGIHLLLRIIRTAEVRSEASTAASRALFILTCARPMVADVLRWNGGLGPCTMLLTAGPGAEATLWACTLLGLLADGDRSIQDGIAENGGLELLLGLIKSRAQAKDVAVAAARTFALLLVDNRLNQDKAIEAGAIRILIKHLKASFSATTSRKFLSRSCPSSVLLFGLQPVSSQAGPESPLHSRLQLRLQEQPGEAVTPSQECLDGMAVEMTEMLIVALANLSSGGLGNRKAVQQAGGLLLIEDLMRAEAWKGNIARLANWAHGIICTAATGPVATTPRKNPDHPLFALMTSR